MVVFPYMTIPLLVGRVPSINAIEKAVAADRLLFVTAQRRSEVADPTHQELYKVGTLVRVLQLFRLPDGTMRALVEGLCRCRVERFAWSSDYYTVRVSPIEDARSGGAEVEALMRHVLTQFNEYVHLNRRIPDEVLTAANNLTDPVTLAHTVSAHLLVKVAQKQRLLEVDGELERLKMLSEILSSELEIVKLERKLEGQVRSQVHKNQKEFYLNEQLKAIRKELGHQNEFASEIDEVGAAIKKARMPREVVAKAMKELDRLSKMSFMSPEATVVRIAVGERGHHLEVAGVLGGANDAAHEGAVVGGDHGGRQLARVAVDGVAEQHQLHDRHTEHHREGQAIAPELHELLAQHGHDAAPRQAEQCTPGPATGSCRSHAASAR